MKKTLITTMVMLISAFINTGAIGQSKWVEVKGTSAYVLLNSMDILDPRNEAEKKRLIILATIEAAKNGVKVSADAVLNSPEFNTVLENPYLSEDDYLFRAFENQNIQWQRLETPSFTRDTDNKNKWICNVKGLVKISSNNPVAYFPPAEKPIKNEPAPYYAPSQPTPIQPVVKETPKTDKDVFLTYSDKKFKKKYHFGFNFGVNSYIDNGKVFNELSLTNLNYKKNPLTFNVGIIFPIGKNIRMGIDYSNTTYKISNANTSTNSTSSVTDVTTLDHRRNYYYYNYYNDNTSNYDDDYSSNYQKLAIHGARITFGSYRNAINPYIGGGFNYGKNEVYSDNVTNIIGAQGILGIDFGRKNFKLGVEATSTWFESSNKVNGVETASKKFNINDFNISVGGTIKLLF